MRRILLVKTSSLGDVVHNLPVVSDIRDGVPGVAIDWVVEDAFAAIPRLHAGVTRVIPVAIRRWRREISRASTRRECRAFLTQLREHEYEAIVDTQGLLKSALVTCAARGPGCGLDWTSSREPLRLFYQRTFSVPWGQHAVARNRSLAAQALAYASAAPARYGIQASRRAFAWLPAARYAVLLHATSAAPKLWPENHWRDISNYLFSNNIISVLPWGSNDERARSERLARSMSNAVIAPALALDAMAALLAQAQVVAGVDTGLTHLAAALNVPTVGIYCATDAAATGIYACARGVNVGGIGLSPTVQQVIAAIRQVMP